MSYNTDRSASVDFGEHHSREHINYNGCKIDLTPDYPDDFAEGWEHYQQYHICWICEKQGHESSMERNALHYWVHTECQEYINTLTKNIQP